MNEQSKSPANNGIERERRNHVDCPAQGTRRLHDGIHTASSRTVSLWCIVYTGSTPYLWR